MRFLLNGALCAAAFALAACNSSGGQQAPANGQEVEWIGPDGPEPYDPNITKDRRLAGAVLADVDKSLRIWVNITLTGNSAKDGSTLNIVEADLRRKVRAKLLVIVEQLETGPPINRQIAAAALGFSGDPKTLSPLLAALEDDSPDVVANALLGLSVLADPDTPRILVAAELEDVNQPFNVRSQAARALRAVGLYDLGEADRAAVIRAARAALGDANEGLRPTGARRGGRHQLRAGARQGADGPHAARGPRGLPRPREDRQRRPQVRRASRPRPHRSPRSCG